MKRFFAFAALAIVVGVGGLFVYARYFPPYTNRFRLTIEVQTPDGIKSGSSVIQTTYWESGGWGPVEASGVRAEAHGEAVFVDLGHNQNLVALLSWGSIGSEQDKIYGLTRAALASGQRIDWKDEYKLKGKGDLPSDYVPTMVTFIDLNDPKSARLVWPNEFEKVFGARVSFRSASIETTSDPISRTIEKKLPMLVTRREELRRAYSFPGVFTPQFHLFTRE